MVQETSKFLFITVGKNNNNKHLHSGFFGPDAIRPFDAKDVEIDLKAKKFKTKDLELAVRQALNPSLLTDLEQEEEEISTKKVKGKKKAEPKPNGTTKKKDTTTIATKRRSRNLQVNQEKEEEMVDETAVSENVKKRVSCILFGKSG